MGGLTLLTLFVASEIGGSAPTDVLKPAGSTVLPNGGDALVATPGAGPPGGQQADERLAGGSAARIRPQSGRLLVVRSAGV